MKPATFFRKGFLNTFDFLNPSAPTSPVPYLLAANTPATEEERLATRTVVVTARQQRTALAKHIGKGNPQVDSESKRDSLWLRRQERIVLLDEFIEAHEALISPSPIFELPVELLQEIFKNVADLLSSESVSNIHNTNTIDISHLPWAISRVCQLWRAVTLSTPYLWRSMPVISLQDQRWKEPHFMGLLQELLDRSQGSSLVLLGLDTGFHPELSLHPALQLLAEHSKRWASLTLRVGQDGLRIIKDIVSTKGKFESLHVVDISFYSQEPQPSLNLLEVAPLLEDIRLNDPPIVFGSLPTSSRLQRLTLKGRSAIIQHYLQFIHNSSATLTHLYLSITGYILLDTLVVLPNLWLPT